MTKVLVSCVGEDRAGWHTKIENLVLSIRRFGGSMREAPIVVNVVNSAERRFRERLNELDAEIRLVERVDPRAPSSNKLRMLELPSSHDFDVLVALDCDLIAMGDFTPEVAETSSLRAAPAIHDPLPAGSWELMYRELGLNLPEKRHIMTVSGQTTYPYFNSGVMFVARECCELLHESWDRERNRLLDLNAKYPGLLGSKVRGDQPALACALQSAGLKVDPLPINLNLSTRVRSFSKEYGHQWGPPFIFHYHDWIDPGGFLMKSPNRKINSFLDEFNRFRAEATGSPYTCLPRPSISRRLLEKAGYRWGKRRYASVRRIIKRQPKVTFRQPS